jgi:hypothetical protein
VDVGSDLREYDWFLVLITKLDLSESIIDLLVTGGIFHSINDMCSGFDHDPTDLFLSVCVI